ncbi:glycosyltransferase family 2 protein [Flavobacterium sp. ARAG 55.4]|uniref:glycosyltransferase family 2 protein n=1 Tax=Flavobacterium sp. ARAG 55.4 TaxID=3451357 RepID=UPI003F4623D9
MITLVLTIRNRNLRIVKNCLQSLSEQSCTDFEVFLVDYGSNKEYKLQLVELLKKYSQINYIDCPVQGQLWNKSRAINIALKQSNKPYFFVGDIDMLYRHDFVEKLYRLKKEDQAVYFQVGVLSQSESIIDKPFEDYIIKHKTNEEATGMTLYPTELLKKINGYDEFYHGWGAEDTDVHIRLRNAGNKVKFYDKEILIKHQWHSKNYRTIQSTYPYHFTLERINHSYIQLSQSTKKIIANVNSEWGVLPNKNHYSKLLENPNLVIEILPDNVKLDAFLAQMDDFENKVISLIIKNPSFLNKIEQQLKKVLGKKYLKFLSMKKVNDMILREIVLHYRNLPYQYSFESDNNKIQFKIYFP